MKPETSAKVMTHIKKHVKTFSASKKGLILKVEADRDLALTRAQTNIGYVLGMIKSLNVIDEYTAKNPIDLLGVDGNVVCFTLKKHGANNVVHVFTDGKRLMIRAGGFLIDFGGDSSKCIRCDDIEDIDKYDWVAFSDLLLEFIYGAIYNNVKLTELALFGNSK